MRGPVAVDAAWLRAVIVASLVGSVTIGGVAADTCGVQPLSLPWVNVTLGDGIAVERGIYLRAGGSQSLGLRATTTFNNTRLRSARDCQQQGNVSSISACQGSSGSIFDVTKSSTWVAAPPGAWNVSTIDHHRPDETVLDGYDDVDLVDGAGQSHSLTNFPLEIWSNLASDNMSGLAIGPSSSFLDHLLSAQAVPSRVFGLFFGSRSQLHGQDGNLTIGGYDAARLAGPWTNFTTGLQDLNTPCPLQVRVKDIRLNNANGSFSLFADKDSTIAACIDPLVNAFTLTDAIYARFAQLTDHPGNNSLPGEPAFSQQTFPLSSEPLLGNLTVVLANGYTTTIPHYELVSQERGSNAEGSYAVVNASRLMSAVTTAGNDSAGSGVTPILGGVYLSQNYLLVDYDQHMFSLAPVVGGPLPDDGHRIVSLCNGTGQTGTASSTPVGAIAGGVVGGVAGVCSLLGLLYLWRRRRRDPKTDLPEEKEEKLEPSEAFGPAKEVLGSLPAQELSPHQRPRELSTAESELTYVAPELETGAQTDRMELDGTGVR